MDAGPGGPPGSHHMTGAGAAGPPHQPPPGAIFGFPATFTLDGRFIQFNVFGNILEVTAKYRPPIIPVGQGARGLVCSVFNSETNENVAVKKIANAFANDTDAKRTLREIKLLRHMDHENIIAVKDIIPPHHRGAFNDVYIAYELMDADLKQIISSNQDLTEIHCQYLLYQILRGLKYIHSAHVLHRDIKPSNLLLNSVCEVKICDFGLARVNSESAFMTEDVVTTWYRAPELLLNSSGYTSAIDVWATGCVFMELMIRRPVFPGRDLVHQIRMVLELLGTPSEDEMGFLNENAKRFIWHLGFFPRRTLAEMLPNVNPLGVDLVQKMLTFDPRRRINAVEALAHPYLHGLHDVGDEPVCPIPFDFAFERFRLSAEQIKELIYREALAFNPGYQ